MIPIFTICFPPTPLISPACGGSATPASTTVTESGVTVWSTGRFVPGQPGITFGQATGSKISLTLTSGTYSFAVRTA